MNTATIPFCHRAVEPDSLIAVLRHYSCICVIRLPVTGVTVAQIGIVAVFMAKSRSDIYFINILYYRVKGALCDSDLPEKERCTRVNPTPRAARELHVCLALSSSISLSLYIYRYIYTHIFTSAADRSCFSLASLSCARIIPPSIDLYIYIYTHTHIYLCI